MLLYYILFSFILIFVIHVCIEHVYTNTLNRQIISLRNDNDNKEDLKTFFHNVSI